MNHAIDYTSQLGTNTDRFSLLPDQFYDSGYHSGSLDLVFAILDDLLVSLLRETVTVRPNRRTKRLLAEDMDYLLSNELLPFSFLHCCLILDLDMDYLRRGILGKLDEARASPGMMVRRSHQIHYAKERVSAYQRRRHR